MSTTRVLGQDSAMRLDANDFARFVIVAARVVDLNRKRQGRVSDDVKPG